MFGIGIAKLVFTIAVIIVVWSGARWWARVQARARAEVAKERQSSMQASERAMGARPLVEETTRCAVCDAYVAAWGARSCGRGDCPYPP